MGWFFVFFLLLIDPVVFVRYNTSSAATQRMENRQLV